MNRPADVSLEWQTEGIQKIWRRRMTRGENTAFVYLL
jgi:hypothetical protein